MSRWVIRAAASAAAAAALFTVVLAGELLVASALAGLMIAQVLHAVSSPIAEKAGEPT